MGVAILKDSSRGKCDLIAPCSEDRLGRSLQHLVTIMGELQAVGVGFYLHQQALDTTTPAGRAMLQMCVVFAEFERSMVVERVNAGLFRARAQGKVLGRPKGLSQPRSKTLSERRWWAGLAS